jgi:hypothetical protein
VDGRPEVWALMDIEERIIAELLVDQRLVPRCFSADLLKESADVLWENGRQTDNRQTSSYASVNSLEAAGALRTGSRSFGGLDFVALQTSCKSTRRSFRNTSLADFTFAGVGQ